MSEGGGILCLYAHPDDETFSCGGTICSCRDSGVPVSLVTATRGQAGKCGAPPFCTREELPVVRERELHAAAAILGIGEVVLLDYEDRRLADARPQDVRAQLVSVIRRTRPLIVITFDPHGYNAHPDHIAISRFAADAVAAAADHRFVPAAGTPFAVRRMLWTTPVAPWDLAATRSLETAAGTDFVVDVSRWRDRKAAALRAHRTQHASIERHFFARADAERALAIEAFRQGWGPPLAARPSRDLFEGLRDDSRHGR